ncbi:MAG: AAA family ATPase [Pricia sp.]
MKILNIHFKNINSLKGTHHIDFTKAPFDTSPLFAITGPTGSGKSTLLDVIALALFNQVPRLGKISKKEILEKGAIVTRNQKEAVASVKYQCNAGTFTSSWSISTNKKHQLRDYEMEIADESGTILDVKRSRVPAQNEKLIGLNYDQFIKSVLLAQGEFAQFLKAKKDERGALLEKITGTGIYRELGRKAYERFRSESRKIEKQQNEILTHQNELLEAPVLAYFTDKFKAKKESIATLETQIKKLEKDIGHKEALAKTEKDITTAEEKRSEEKDKMDAFLKRSGPILSHHEKVRPIADELRKWASVQERLVELEKQYATLSKNKEANEKAIGDLLTRVSGLIGTETAPERIEKDIMDFSEAVRELQKTMADKLKDHSNTKTLITEQAKETAFTYDPEADNHAKLKALQTKSARKLDELQKRSGIERTADVMAFREALKEKLNRSQQLEKNSIALEQERKNLQQYTTELEQLAAQQKGLPSEIELAEARAKRFEAEANALQKSLEIERLRASLDEHRAKLQENEPCPLCGSLEHPFASHLPTDRDTDEVLKTLRKEFEKWNDVFVSKKSQWKVLNERNKELLPKMASLSEDIKKLAAQEKDLSKGLSLETGTSWGNFTQACQLKLDAVDQLENEKRMLAQYNLLLPNLEKLDRITKEGKQIRTQLLKKYDGPNINSDSHALLTQWTELKKERHLLDHRLGEAKTEVQAKRNENRSLENRLRASESLADFETVSQAHKSLLDERTFNRLQAEKSEITTALHQCDTTIKLLKKQLEDAKKTEVTETADQLQQQYKTKLSELETIREERNELERALTNHRKKTEKITALKQQIAAEEKQIKRWKLLNELIGDAQGKRFNDFAQDLTLRHLVILANIRLADLSDRYRLDTPTDDEDDGLIVLDDHMGSQRRSVRTLSGGETFLLSLSMALALSDLASRNVEINSLFIDEGFGTLDPETLDQTLDTLEKLQSESSKTIGIISHVDSLKERIATQIQLERNGQGYSSLRIVY